MSQSSIARLTQLAALSAAIISLAACGVPKSEIHAKSLYSGITGGDLATGTEDFAKSTVMLIDVKQGALCTASIIASNLAITAAHCVASPAQDLVLVFGTDIQATDIIKRRVVAYETTPLWASRQNEQLNTGDMALVSFSGGIPQGYQVARMLGDISKLSDGQEVLLAGYGEADSDSATGAGKLRSVSVKIAQVALSPSEILFMQTDGKGACHGDSGGPAYATVDGAAVLIGVTSRGVDKCRSETIYTNIPYYADWIVRTAKSLSAQLPVNNAVAAPTAASPVPIAAAPAAAVRKARNRRRAAPKGQPKSSIS